METRIFSYQSSAKPKGPFKVVEGLDSSGKTTQCAKLLSFFNGSGHQTELWRFPDSYRWEKGFYLLLPFSFSNCIHFLDPQVTKVLQVIDGGEALNRNGAYR